MSKLRVYSMFAGIGGLDLGLESTGHYETVLFSEVDKYCNRVLAHHWPDVPNIGDCSKADYTEWVGKVDVIAAGFPCQDISIAGKQKGIQHDTRSGLWAEVVRAIRDIRPRIVILENVAAILTSNDGRDFNRVLADLHECGYHAEWRIVRASDVGAFHQRARWFCVAWPRRLGYSHDDGRAQAHGGIKGTSQEGPPVDGTDDVGNQQHRGADRADQELEHSQSAGSQKHNASTIGARSKQRSAQGGTRIFTEPPSRSTYWDTAILHRGRPVEPSIPLLLDGVPDRVARVRAAGNAVVPQVAEYVGRMALNAL